MATVRGIKEINDILEKLPDRMQQNVIAAGNRAVAKAIADEAKRADIDVSIKAAVHFEQDPRRRRTKAFLVGLRRPWSKLGHLFEFGTQERVQKTTGRATGRMPKTPWLRPALEAIGGKAADIWSKAASRNLDRQLKKMAK